VKLLQIKKQASAFSLFEILVVLTITGILLTFTRLDAFSNLRALRVESTLQHIQLEVDKAILRQLTLNSSKQVKVKFKNNCQPKSAEVFYGGWMQEYNIMCGSKQFRINALGEVTSVQE
jgi:type II secretory pathway pseudopilin PulG